MNRRVTYQPWRFLRETAGDLGTASLLLCLVTGVVLAIPYDVQAPYASVSLMVTANPFAALFRNLHYWSAQSFLVFTLIHLTDYIRQRGERSQRPGMWIWLNIMLGLSFLLMLTGFILKGDAESMQAQRILRSLLQTLPFSGDFLSTALLGKYEDLQLIYVHHIATGSIIISVVVYAHIRRLWTGWRAMWLCQGFLLMLSLLRSAPLHRPDDMVL
ncbi:MAG: cytochrome b N-terminal domain-containing protein, partial [Bacteroidales bacterium]|nr:cytochrome b N-terminal domain-containing protein [Bacteroidales bacterium]